MWTNLALALALTATLGQADQLTISNIRATHGYLGAERLDNKLLPGDAYLLAFEVDGLKVDPSGKATFTLAMQVSDSNGKVISNPPPRNQEVYLTLGGSKLQASATVDILFNQAPGDYTVKVSVTDNARKASGSFTRKIEVLPKDFGIVQLYTSFDPNGRFPCPSGGVTGQYLTVNFRMVGFQCKPKDKDSKQPDVTVELRVLDEDGKPTLQKPFEGRDNNAVELDTVWLPMQFHLALNRPGKFTVELQATDNLSKKIAKKVTLPLTVTEQKASSSAEEKSR
jgi:hypothetical protein